jgi:hypothetical protein
MLLQRLESMKDTISEEWALNLIYRFCYRHRFTQPNNQGPAGFAFLKIIDFLMKVRGISSIFELLNFEQNLVYFKV